MLLFGEINAKPTDHQSDENAEHSSKKKPHKKQMSDVDIVINELTLQAEQSNKLLNKLPFDKVTKTIRVYLEGQPENANGVSDEDYFALFEKVYHKIMKTDDKKD